MKSAAQVMLCLWTMVVTAQELPCLVESTNHGGGVYSYTFRQGDIPYVWGLSTNGAYLFLHLHGILEAVDPPGWTHSISPSGRITWTPTNGLVFLEEPITFTVRSCLTESATYGFTWSDGAPSGVIAGLLYTVPEHAPTIFGGAQSFVYVGPVLPALAIERTAANTVIRWPAAAQGLTLETADALAPGTAWNTVTNQPVVVGTGFNVTIESAQAAQFFRLRTPCSSPP